jgi:hypothetical protein
MATSLDAANGVASAFARPTAWRRLVGPARTLWNWTYSNVHEIYQSYKVVEFMFSRRLGAGALPPDHPWVTGESPHTGGPIWPRNIVMASPRKDDWLGPPPEPDAVIVTRVGRFLSAMVKRSTVANPEIPQGPTRRMPHAVNHLHGAVHFNGGYAIFNDFRDGMCHLSDPAFVREMKRYARGERRELTLVLRERQYHPEEYAWFVAFVRAHVPWYANGNGPTQKRVLMGTPSPYPAVNPINGSWIADVERLRRGDLAGIVRPPITGSWFPDRYQGTQSEYGFLERFQAWVLRGIIRAKGFQGNLVFTSRRRIESENWKLYKASGGRWSATYPVSHPFQRIETARARRTAVAAHVDLG